MLDSLTVTNVLPAEIGHFGYCFRDRNACELRNLECVSKTAGRGKLRWYLNTMRGVLYVAEKSLEVQGSGGKETLYTERKRPQDNLPLE